MLKGLLYYLHDGGGQGIFDSLERRKTMVLEVKRVSRGGPDVDVPRYSGKYSAHTLPWQVFLNATSPKPSSH